MDIVKAPYIQGRQKAINTRLIFFTFAYIYPQLKVSIPRGGFYFTQDISLVLEVPKKADDPCLELHEIC